MKKLKEELIEFIKEEREFIKEELKKDYSKENKLLFRGRLDELNIIEYDVLGVQ